MTSPLRFPSLPSELLLHILSYLDIPDLLSLSRTSHTFRTLSLDPLLHITRLHHASLSLAHAIALRPCLAELMAHRIYITRTTLAARHLGRNFIKIRLNRQLLKRPSVDELVQLGVLPRECYSKGRQGGTGVWLAPGLVEVKRRVERERVKDCLRGWVDEWRRRGWERRRRELEGREMEAEGRPDVRRLVRRFTRERDGVAPARNMRWGRAAVLAERKEAPTRAKVSGLRRFWERVDQEGVGS
ncbi:Uncharacterized protein BP5553_04394 [Venustampulla echinocandica]|uniref:F-box domain-containing protein n=1 Tax=Venustampulla echinocandica TaxID=2656787 RepID=A0A370TN62_9HELO|nr:Uncharacterized protein BP5553_04394 [Venustampulla echinocandica]RDL36961.1 Uncharacterized protein BP5553_04394 [Venustampulla echinocandica]